MPNSARLEHQGGAVPTTLAADMTSGVTACLLAASTNWPTGGTGPFYIVIDPGESNEEKILATSRTSNQLNTLVRGADGTTASAHVIGAVVMHVFSADEADAANILVNLFQQVTSSTRPATPAVGMQIYETDTGNQLTYQGATDTWTPPWNTAWGFVGQVTLSTDVGPSTNFDTGLSLSLTSIANRRWRVTMNQLLLAASADTQAFSIVKVSTGAAVMVGGSNSRLHHGNTYAEGGPVVGYLTTLAEAITLKSSMVTSSGGNFTFKGTVVPGFLLVEDIGPAGAPA